MRGRPGRNRVNRRLEAAGVRASLEEQAPKRYVSPYYLAKIHTQQGNVEEALAWLERDYRGRNPNFIDLGVEPALDQLRGNPRFRDLLRRVGLP